MSGMLFRGLCPQACIVRCANRHGLTMARRQAACIQVLWHSLTTASSTDRQFTTPYLLACCRGPLNKRNVIPLKFIFSEPDKYGPLVEDDEHTGKYSGCRG